MCCLQQACLSVVKICFLLLFLSAFLWQRERWITFVLLWLFLPLKTQLKGSILGHNYTQSQLAQKVKKKKNSSSPSKYQAANESSSSESRGNINHFLLKTYIIYFIAPNKPHSFLCLYFKFPLWSAQNTVCPHLANSLKSKKTFVSQFLAQYVFYHRRKYHMWG